MTRGIHERQLHLLTHNLGKKIREQIPTIWRLARELEPEEEWDCGKYEGGTLTCGTTLIHIGKPALPLRIFNETTYKRLMLIPHLTARGPNGAWLTRRGPNHPHLSLTENRTAYYVAFDGQPTYYSSQHASTAISTLELFRTHDEAKDSIFDVPDDEFEKYKVCQTSSKDLYDLMIGMDVIEYEGQHLVLTRFGAYHAEEEYEESEMDHTLSSFLELLQAPD